MSSTEMPAVRYRTVVRVDRNGNFTTDYAGRDTYDVHNVVNVVKGRLESVLHLIGYSYPQIRKINRLISIKYPEGQSQEFLVSSNVDQIPEEMKKSRPTRAHIVQYENKLYGVIIDNGMAIICGYINCIIPNSKDNNDNFRTSSGIRITSAINGSKWDFCGREVLSGNITQGKNVIGVSEKGALFVSPNTRNEPSINNQLLLVLGHGFVIFAESPQTPVIWIRSKQGLREDKRESRKLCANESIIVAFAAIKIVNNEYQVYGTGSVVSLQTIRQNYDPM